jgi:membrane protease YdiL (CAAX protease family)
VSDGLTAQPLAIEPAEVRRRTAATVVVAYACALLAVEALAAYGSPVTAAALNGALLVVLLGHHVVDGERALAALALVPLLRLSSLALATGDPVAALVAGGIPVLLAVGLAAHTLELDGILRFREIRRRSQWQFALAAFALAGVLDLMLFAGPISISGALPALLAGAIAVFVFVGVLEELLFRGLVQVTMVPLLGLWAVPMADGLFAAAYLGAAAGYAAVMAAFGLVCGWWVQRTGSLAGAAFGHGLLAAGLLVIWPAVH